jgi:hypothetical protein
MNIDPVKAVCQKYDCVKTDDIQNLNDACYSICGAYNIKSCEKDCEVFIEKQRKRIFGVGYCDHQTPHKPVYWNQVPRYVPGLLRSGDDVQIARDKCKQMCSTQRLANECSQYCDLDADAVTVQPLKEEFNLQNLSNEIKSNHEAYNENTQSNNMFLYSIALVSVIVLFLMIKKL